MLIDRYRRQSIASLSPRAPYRVLLTCQLQHDTSLSVFYLDRLDNVPIAVRQLLESSANHHRAEHQIAVRGTARVTTGDKVQIVHKNESIYVPIGSQHRQENLGKIDLELIEVQTGSYLGKTISSGSRTITTVHDSTD